MKIAILQPRLYYFVGGGEKIPYFHAIHLAKEGHEVDLYITQAKYTVRIISTIKNSKRKQVKMRI